MMSDSNVYATPKANLESAQDPNNLKDVLIAAQRQKTLILTFSFYAILMVISKVIPDEVQTISQLLVLVLLVAIVVFTARLAFCVYGKITATILSVLSIIPLVNLLIMVSASSRANKLIRSKGFKVGFHGANIDEIKQQIAQQSG